MHPQGCLLRIIIMKQKRPKDIFNIISEIDPPVGLKEAVFERIAKERQKQIFRKKMLYFGGFLISIFGLFVSVVFFGRNIIASDFWSISSLAFSDMKIVSAYWQEFSLSLLETFPFEEMAFVLVPVFIILALVRKYNENVINLRYNLN